MAERRGWCFRCRLLQWVGSKSHACVSCGRALVLTWKVKTYGGAE